MAINSGHDKFAARAAYSLGVLLTRQGDAEGARKVFELAINSGHDETAARAAYGLGDLLAEQGDAQGARKAFELAINSGHDEYAVSAAYSFGALLTSSPSAPGTPMLRRLRRSASGTLLAMTGDAEGAREALQQAIDSGHAEFAARAKQALDELGSGGRLPTG